MGKDGRCVQMCSKSPGGQVFDFSVSLFPARVYFALVFILHIVEHPFHPVQIQSGISSFILASKAPAPSPDKSVLLAYWVSTLELSG